VEVEFVLETRGREHLREVIEAVKRTGRGDAKAI
jgi:hypothetical protein